MPDPDTASQSNTGHVPDGPPGAASDALPSDFPSANTLLPAAVALLRDADVADPARDARACLALALGVLPARLTLHLGDRLTAAQQTTFQALITRRARREPISHLRGHRAFFGRMFRVTSAVLDPRPETEVLVHCALRHTFARILDLGTGSGAILLSLLADRPEATGVGCDISPDALAVARDNRDQMGLAARAQLIRSDWFEHVRGPFDLIVSNPPYIPTHVYETLQPEVRQWEPKLALTPGDDGLSPYRLLTAAAPNALKPRGRLMVEIGYDQGEAVRALFQRAGFADVTLYPDLDGRDRVVAGLWRGPC